MKIADAYVEISADARKFDTKLTKIKGALSGLAGSVVPIAFAGGAVGLIGSLSRAVTVAGDLGETLSKVEVVMGGASKEIISFANQMSSKFGVSKTEILDAASSLALMGREARLSEADAAQFAKTMVRTADDAASMFNTSFSEAFLKIRSGLAGESEPLRAFNVFLTEAAVKAEGARLGMLGLDGELTEGAKIMARASLELKGLSVSMGDHERTFDSLTNKFKEAGGRLGMVQEDIGSATGKLVEPVLDQLNRALRGYAMASELFKVQFLGKQFDPTSIPGLTKMDKVATSVPKPSVTAEQAAAEAEAKRVEHARQTIAKEEEAKAQAKTLAEVRDKKKVEEEYQRYVKAYPGSVGMAHIDEFRKQEAAPGKLAGTLGRFGGALLGMAGGKIAGVGGLAAAAVGGLGGVLGQVMDKKKEKSEILGDDDVQKYLQENANVQEDNSKKVEENTTALQNLGKDMQDLGKKLGLQIAGRFGAP